MKIRKHVLDHSTASGNGHHGDCLYCNLALVIDLGYCSWDGVECNQREVVSEFDVPMEVKGYAHFNGLIFSSELSIKNNTAIYVKPYANDQYTFSVDEIAKMIKEPL